MTVPITPAVTARILQPVATPLPPPLTVPLPPVTDQGMEHRDRGMERDGGLLQLLHQEVAQCKIL